MKKLNGKLITVPFARKLIGLPGKPSSKYNRCVGGKLFGSHPGSQVKARENFSEAAKGCKGTKGS